MLMRATKVQMMFSRLTENWFGHGEWQWKQNSLSCAIYLMRTVGAFNWYLKVAMTPNDEYTCSAKMTRKFYVDITVPRLQDMLKIASENPFSETG
ncbi:hypothetical protein HHK36_032581 [Tetracentron sinense]|uniref:Uncharacterized protein n=1 Tax=Tetracentron sinense TaxID=13715 RepID=A0A834Y8Z1_TETSI|nr:hypothetical protein HHK36_032581 [Tetracentron sinense]